MSPLTRRLDRLDGGLQGRIEEMSDAQLLRIIRCGLSPADREAYDVGTPAERDAILTSIANKAG